MTGVCEVCGGSFSTYPSKQQRFCSKSCRAKWQAQAHPQPGLPNQGALAWGDATRGTGDSYVQRNGRHEHRVVAEKKLGRALRPGEVVHHIDGDRQNNDPGNLMVLPNHAAHMRQHARERKGL